MIILGIDPGYAIVGFGVIEVLNAKFKMITYGAITTKPDEDFPNRLKEIYRDLCRIIDVYNPDAVAIEELFYHTNQKTVIKVGQARGVILLAACEKEKPVYEYTPLQVKQAVVGYGRAEKRQVMDLTRRFLGLEKVPKPDDAADALAVAVCHAHTAMSFMPT